MVHNAAGPLTRISFRRDVRVFLIALVGFLGLLICALLLVMQGFGEDAQANVIRRWNAVADAGAADIASAGTEATRRVRAQSLAGRYAILAVDFGQQTTVPPVGYSIVRQIGGREIRFVFDEQELQTLQRRFAMTASISVAAAVTVMVLLVFYIPRITRPIESMLGDARALGARDERQEETAYLVSTFRESISKLREQEHELKRLHEAEKNRADELEMVTATLTRSLTSGLIALDPRGNVLEINAAAREVLGITAVGETSVALADLIGDSPLSRAIHRAIELRETLTRIEVEHETGTSTIAIGLTAVPLVGEGGRLLGLLALFTDLTPIKRLEARVRAMQTLADLGEMAAGIVHELRNSLSTIVGYMRLAQRSDLPAEAAARLRSADQEAGQLHSAVERLLAFARPMDLQVEPTDLRELVAAVVSRLSEQTGDIAVAINGSAEIDADPTLLSRAIENVLRNAIDAVADRGPAARIDVTITTDPPTLVITDNGIGLDGSRADRLLLPFVSEKPGGFGLGLSLARKIAILHGGDIELTGSPGHGATVTMHLPRRSDSRGDERPSRG